MGKFVRVEKLAKEETEVIGKAFVSEMLKAIAAEHLLLISIYATPLSPVLSTLVGHFFALGFTGMTVTYGVHIHQHHRLHIGRFVL